MKWFRNWRLRKAREQHAYWKARLEVLSQRGPHDFCFFTDWNIHCRDRADVAGKVALYEERVETLMRE